MTRWMSPDFVMLGVSTPDGVALYASTSLTQARLEAEVHLLSPLIPSRFALPPERVFNIQAEMHEITLVLGKDYAEAMSTLMRTWQPPQPKRPAALPGRRALERG